ncbi:NifU family protein [Rhodobium gokarnense]|uniref:Fe-S cluster biogenesis protein NfuA n=1 Tax=Rhodobium gokarnense TaxID=364296 RepID=A0ABT3HIJ4_9HYPH|nr:NifU family protein [Rhodobium gokarnense]MCW2310081.1 Fe-S cluster biogenesis protein NfuA [Rhodobium gokarnense]
MFIQTEATPNPATLKFLPGKPVLAEGTRDFRKDADASASPLAMRLFGIPGVTGVFFGTDFISVTKQDGDWQHLKPAVLGAIMEHFVTGEPVMAEDTGAGGTGEEFYGDRDADTVGMIKELLETRVRPAVAQDGGDITFKGYDEGIVYLSMRGACAGCPSSTATLKHGIENLLKHFVPEVVEVRQI